MIGLLLAILPIAFIICLSVIGVVLFIKATNDIYNDDLK